jgi:SAM-dependent methyltransferase
MDGDDRLLTITAQWQGAIAQQMATVGMLTPGAIAQGCHAWILGLLGLRLCQRIGLLPATCLQTLSQQPGLDAALKTWMQSLNQSYRGLIPDAWLQGMYPLCDDVLGQCLHDLVALPPLTIEQLGQVAEQLTGLHPPLHRADGRSPLSHRKAQGIYYTPAAIAQFVVNHTLRLDDSDSPEKLAWIFQTPDSATIPGKESKPKRVLDLACGSGIFLLFAYRTLTAHAQQTWGDRPFTAEEQFQWRSRLLTDSLFGLDLDPAAVTVTRFSLQLELLAGCPIAALPTPITLPNLSGNLRCGNALVPLQSPVPYGDRHTSASLAIASESFDWIVGNPPYLDSEAMSQVMPEARTACTAYYTSATGNWDLFCVFIEQALTLCKPGGRVGLVVPNKLLSAHYAAGVRSLLSQRYQVYHIRDYSQVPCFAGASVYPIAMLVQSVPPTQTTVPYEAMESLSTVRQVQLLQMNRGLSLEAKPAHLWLIIQSSVHDRIMHQLQALPTLGEWATISGAATVAEAYEWRSLLQDCNGILEDGDRQPMKVVNSGTVDRYRLLWGEKPLRYLKQLYHYPIFPKGAIATLRPKRRQQVLQPKLIIAGMTQALECALDPDGQFLAAKSTSIIIDLPLDSLHWLLSILNSRLMSIYFTSCFAGNRLKGGYWRIGPPQLRQLPIPAFHCDQPTALQRQILALTQARLRCAAEASVSQLVSLDRALDELVCAHYGLQPSEIAWVLDQAQ